MPPPMERKKQRDERHLKSLSAGNSPALPWCMVMKVSRLMYIQNAELIRKNQLKSDF